MKLKVGDVIGFYFIKDNNNILQFGQNIIPPNSFVLKFKIIGLNSDCICCYPIGNYFDSKRFFTIETYYKRYANSYFNIKELKNFKEIKDKHCLTFDYNDWINSIIKFEDDVRCRKISQ